MKLKYEAVNRAGESVSGSLDAPGVAEATEKLFADGLYVTSVAPAGGGDNANPGRAPGRFARRAGKGGGRLKQVAAVTRQLSVLTSTGTSVVAALSAVDRQLPPGMAKTAVSDVLHRVEEGSTMSVAMAEHPTFFDAVYRSLIAAGESGGQLPKMLDRLGTMTRKQLKIRNTVTGALAYPVMLTIMAVCVVVVMLLAVLPKFAGLFKTLDAPMPPTTKMLMAMSDALRNYWYAFALALAALITGVVWFIRSSTGRRTIDNLALRLPLFGPFVRSLITARIVRTLGVLMEGRVPLLDALTLIKGVAGNAHYAALITRAENAVTRGESISSAFRDSPLISPAVYEAVLTGERSGQVGPILVNLAEFLDEDNEVVIKSIMSLIEPLILVLLGVVVGFVALSLFLPLFDLTSAADGGAGAAGGAH